MVTFAGKKDAYGRALWDGFRGLESCEIVERDDGFIDSSLGAAAYLAPYSKWPAYEKRAIRLAKGRVLDVGCGSGRVALYLQKKGHDVVGIDNSPFSIKVCRARGLRKARLMSITEAGPRLGTFDTIVMFGNNFGLFGGPLRAKALLRRFHGITTPDARILAETADPYRTKTPEHLAYHRFNRRRGRMAGQLRFRIRYRTFASPYFDYLIVSRDEMKEILRSTGWRVARFINSKGPSYIAVMVKVK